MQSWQMQEAKARLSELVERAVSDGPQTITQDGEAVAVVMSRAAFERLAANEESIVQFMRRSPLYGNEDVSFERDESPVRALEL